MVQIVEFADAGEAAFEHLDIGERCDGADVVGGHPIEKAVHGLAPRPEAIARRSAPLGESGHAALERSEEHTSELQSLMRISYAVFCLKKKNTRENIQYS